MKMLWLFEVSLSAQPKHSRPTESQISQSINKSGSAHLVDLIANSVD